MVCKYKLIDDILNLEGLFVSNGMGKSKLKYAISRRHAEHALRYSIKQGGLRNMLEQSIFKINSSWAEELISLHKILEHELLLNNKRDEDIRKKLGIKIPPKLSYRQQISTSPIYINI